MKKLVTACLSVLAPCGVLWAPPSINPAAGMAMRTPQVKMQQPGKVRSLAAQFEAPGVATPKPQVMPQYEAGRVARARGVFSGGAPDMQPVGRGRLQGRLTPGPAASDVQTAPGMTMARTPFRDEEVYGMIGATRPQPALARRPAPTAGPEVQTAPGMTTARTQFRDEEVYGMIGATQPQPERARRPMPAAGPEVQVAASSSRLPAGAGEIDVDAVVRKARAGQQLTDAEQIATFGRRVTPRELEARVFTGEEIAARNARAQRGQPRPSSAILQRRQMFGG